MSMICPPAAFLYLNWGRPCLGQEFDILLSLLYFYLILSRRIGLRGHLFPGSAASRFHGFYAAANIASDIRTPSTNHLAAD